MDQQARELKQNIPGAKVARVGEGIAVTFASGLLYDFDSDVIRGDAASNLRALAASLGKYPNTDLLIVGHTDATGSLDYNQGLSQRRATSAANYLIGEGVNPGRLRAVGRGETEPIAANDTEGGRALNRRVEVAIYAQGAESVVSAGWPTGSASGPRMRPTAESAVVAPGLTPQGRTRTPGRAPDAPDRTAGGGSD
jgi:outer membrane protein OmpA-like peptidoglycan-associated protein